MAFESIRSGLDRTDRKGMIETTITGADKAENIMNAIMYFAMCRSRRSSIDHANFNV